MQRAGIGSAGEIPLWTGLGQSYICETNSYSFLLGEVQRFSG